MRNVNKPLWLTLVAALVLFGLDKAGAFDDLAHGLSSATASATYVAKSGSTMTGDLEMGGYDVRGAAIADGTTMRVLGASTVGGLLAACNGTCPSWTLVNGAGDIGVEDDLSVVDDALLGDDVDVRGAVYVGDGTYSWGICDGSAGEVCIEDELEVDGAARFDGYLYSYSQILAIGSGGVPSPSNQSQVVIGSSVNTAYGAIGMSVDDGLMIIAGVTDNNGNRNVIFTSSANSAKDHDHDTLSTNPTVFYHSALDPDTNNTRWGSLAHTGTAADGGSFNISTGSGPVSILGSGLAPAKVTSDPCGGATYSVGTLFYNVTSGYMCYCNNARADVKMSDDSTACF